MAELYKVEGSQVFGVYFNRPNPYNPGQYRAAITVVQQLKVPALKAGEIIIANAQTTVSCLKNMAVSYPGFHINLFTASQLYMSRRANASSWLEDGLVEINLSTPNGHDIHDGSQFQPMQPYCNHDQTGMHKIKPEQEGDWWVQFCVWCSSSGAVGDSRVKDEYIWVIPQQTVLQIARH